MTYRPNMTNQIEGFSVTECFHRRYWDGMVVDLWDVDCAPRAGGRYLGRDPRLFVLLDARPRSRAAAGGDFIMSEPGGAALQHGGRRAVSFVPAGMEMETEVSGMEHLRHLDLHFDADALRRRLGDDLDQDALDRPRLMLIEPRLIALSELIAAECTAGEPLHDLYGDGLTLSLILAVLKVRPPAKRRRSTLAAWQLRRAIDFIEENCLRPIRLEELARLTGLSESYFSHAFKVATGMPPHQWQTRARIARVKHQLSETDLPLTAIAAETGFSDAAHFSRVFRKEVGISPSAWRRVQGRSAADI